MYAQTIDWLRTQRDDMERELKFLLSGRLNYRLDGADVSSLIVADRRRRMRAIDQLIAAYLARSH
jgi:hypothetical protein